jgi:excinuclease ABC subunit C
VTGLLPKGMSVCSAFGQQFFSTGEERMFDIQEELKKLPGKPGVYIMHDEKDAIIYVGKAVSLKNRVRQYFQSSRNKGAKIEQMVSRISRFEYIVTDSELEALVLECNLIKEHRPKYNTMLKDDKTYPFIKVTVAEPYPRILFSRTMKKDKSRYFGPYTSAGAVKDTIELLHKLYKIRTCQRNLPRDIGKERPCLNYHIKQCLAPCQGYITKEAYRDNVNAAIDFLNGNYDPVIKMLTDRMNEAAEAMEFEAAIEQRELLNSVRQIAQKQKITARDGEDKDVVAVDLQDTDAVVQMFFIRDGRIIGRDHFYLRTAPQDTESGILSSFLKQFYTGTPFIPREIMLPEEVEDAEIIEEWLSQKRGGRVHLRVPKKGTKEKLVELAAKNAHMILSQDKERMKKEEGRTIGAMKELSGWLSLTELVRVEAYDISNISGFESVGSMIVYEKGRPKRSDYRKFRIKTVQGPDDYASMEEVLTRRFTHGLEEQQELKEKNLEKEFSKFSIFPDLIMMDGGKGQVNVALRVLKKLNLTIPVCGMVKDDNHRTRGLYFHNEEIPIPQNSEGFRLITRIQDEAHRFAIEYHRSLRSKEQVHSILDDIEGIGPARRKSLMRTFQSLEAIRDAEIEELKKAPSMNELSARKVYEFFHKSREAAVEESQNL